MSTPETPKGAILIAEDEEHIAKLVAFKLKRGAFEVTVARNGQEAIDLLPSKHWGLLILDIMMPIKTGWEVLKVLRAFPDPAIAATPVLMLTAKGNQAEVANAAELGAAQYLKKPFDPDELLDTVKRLTRHD